MLDFFSFVVDAINMGLQFLGGIIKAFLDAIFLMGSAVHFSMALVGFVPSIIGGCFVAVVTISCVKLLLGR